MAEIARQIEEIQEDFEPDYIILTGDWNCILRNEDTTTQTRKLQTERTLTDLIDTYNLLLHHKTPNPTITWTSNGNPNSKAIHDRIYVSPNLLHNSTTAKLSTTDHMS